MSIIAIVGAGRVGSAAAKILLTTSDHEIALIDRSEEALQDVYFACSELSRPEHLETLYPEIPVETFVSFSKDQLEATLLKIKPDLVICTTPFDLYLEVAQAANRVQAHFVGFTEDTEVNNAIKDLGISRLTFVPQTGLAPGLINYIGLSLFDTLGEPEKLDLRVGALPQVSFGPGHYAITWSPEGLVNEYLKPSFRKVNGHIETVPPLDEHESIIVDGVQYEAFTTAGGIGDLEAYENIPFVEYKSLRFPGHLDHLQKVMAKAEGLEETVQMFKKIFYTTRDDVVVIAAQAVDVDHRSASTSLHFCPSIDLGLTALELTTAGTGIGVVELILNGDLEAGVLDCSEIPFTQLLETNALRLVFDHLM